jgi:hypothetical protein
MARSLREEEFVEVDLSDPPPSLLADLRATDPWTFYWMKQTWRKFIKRAILKLNNLYWEETGTDWCWLPSYNLVRNIEKWLDEPEHQGITPEVTPTESFVEVWIEAQKRKLAEDEFINACVSEITNTSFDEFYMSFLQKIGM